MKKTMVLILLSLFGFLSCSKSGHPDYFGTVKPNHPLNEYWINLSTEPQYMDPTKIADNASYEAVTNMFLRLSQADPNGGDPIPDLAKSWDVSKDGREYTFHLREDAVWSDGKPVTSEDVEYSWKRLADSTTGAQYAQLTDVIENARAFREQAIQIAGLDLKQTSSTISEKVQKIVPVKDVEKDAHSGSFFVFIDSDDGEKKSEFRKKLIDEIEKGSWGKSVHAKVTGSDVIEMKSIDPHTFWVRLKRPVPYFLGLIDYLVFAPLPKHLIEKLKAEGKEDSWVKPENIVVSGPFILTEEEFKQYKIYKKNPKYFDAATVRLEKVKAIIVEDYHADLNAYKTGQHDFGPCSALPTDMVDTLQKFKDYHRDPQLGVYYYEFNIKRKPFQDQDVRVALNLAIDRKAITDRILKEGQTPTRDLVPNGIPGYEGLQSELFNPQKAKELLAKAGFKDGKGFPRLTLKFNTSEAHKKVAEAIQQMWKANLGIQVDIQNMEWRSMLEDQLRKNFDLMRMAWIADYLDPHAFLSIFFSESENNHTGWKNRKYDNLVFQADEIMDKSKRMEKLKEAEKILVEEAPIAPIYFYTRAYMLKPYVRGIYQEYQHRHPWKYVWIDEKWEKGVPADIESTKPESRTN